MIGDGDGQRNCPKEGKASLVISPLLWMNENLKHVCCSIVGNSIMTTGGVGGQRGIRNCHE